MMSTLASSFIGVAPFKMLLPKNIGSVGGEGKVLTTEFAWMSEGESSGASRSSRKRGISRWYDFGGPGERVADWLTACFSASSCSDSFLFSGGGGLVTGTSSGVGGRICGG